MKRILLTLALLGVATQAQAWRGPNFQVFSEAQVAKANAELTAYFAPKVVAPVVATSVVQAPAPTGYDYAALFASAQEKTVAFGKEFMNSKDIQVTSLRNSLAIAAVVTALYGSYRFYKYITTPRD